MNRCQKKRVGGRLSQKGQLVAHPVGTSSGPRAQGEAATVGLLVRCDRERLGMLFCSDTLGC
jgi:hypothetical protein